MKKPALNPRLSRPSGFTLIELLTVIAIIGILAAILIPVVGRVRDSARAAVCTSNMRQIGTALLIYAEEHDGYAPPAQERPGWQETWHGYIRHYAGIESRPDDGIHWRSGSAEETIFHCPMTVNQPIMLTGQPQPESNRITSELGWWSYGMNTQIVMSLHNVTATQAERGDPDRGVGYGLNLDLVQNPSRAAAVLETTDYRARQTPDRWTQYGLAPHGSGSNVLYWDGSVRRESGDWLLNMTPEEERYFWDGD